MECFKHYLTDNVEPTLSYVRTLYRRGNLDEEEYLTLVSCLTEVFEKFGEEIDELFDAIYDKYADEVDF